MIEMIGSWEHGGIRCKIKQGWDNAGRKGETVCSFFIRKQKWFVIMWDGEDDPSLHKADGLLLKVER